jgi:hypothetical protein
MSTPQQFGRSIAVRSVQDLEYLIKESEIYTAQPGREFQLHVGCRMLNYQVCFDGFGYSIVGLSPESTPFNGTLSAQEIALSQFGIAMTESRLFCEPLEETTPCRCKTRTSTPLQ